MSGRKHFELEYALSVAVHNAVRAPTLTSFVLICMLQEALCQYGVTRKISVTGFQAEIRVGLLASTGADIVSTPFSMSFISMLLIQGS